MKAKKSEPVKSPLADIAAEVANLHKLVAQYPLTKEARAALARLTVLVNPPPAADE